MVVVSVGDCPRTHILSGLQRREARGTRRREVAREVYQQSQERVISRRHLSTLAATVGRRVDRQPALWRYWFISILSGPPSSSPSSVCVWSYVRVHGWVHMCVCMTNFSWLQRLLRNWSSGGRALMSAYYPFATSSRQEEIIKVFQAEQMKWIQRFGMRLFWEEGRSTFLVKVALNKWKKKLVKWSTNK